MSARERLAASLEFDFLLDHKYDTIRTTTHARAMQSMNSKESHCLYQTFKDIHDVFKKNGVTYWVTCGTLLGAERHKGLIPWDDDGDLCVMKEDVPKLHKLVATFNRMGYTMEPIQDNEEDEEKKECLGKDKASCTWYISSRSRHALAVDLFIMEQMGPIVQYSDPYWRTASEGKKCVFLTEYLFPLTAVPFGNFWMYAPYNSIQHLNMCYGDDWSSKSYQEFSHRTGKWINTKKKAMSAASFRTVRAPRNTFESTPPPMMGEKYNLRKGVDKLKSHEVRLVAKIYKVPGYRKTDIEKLKKTISNKSVLAPR